MQSRASLQGSPEMGLKSAITNRESEDEYGHLVHEAMKQVSAQINFQLIFVLTFPKITVDDTIRINMWNPGDSLWSFIDDYIPWHLNQGWNLEDIVAAIMLYNRGWEACK